MVHKGWGYHEFFTQQKKNPFKEWKEEKKSYKIKQLKFKKY